MADIKFKNVTGANSNAGSASLKNAGSLFSKAFDDLTGVAKKAQTDLETQNNAQINDSLRRIKTTEDLNTASPGLSIDALTKQFGTGNFNAANASEVLAGKEEEISAQAFADLTRQQGQEDRTQRLADADSTRDFQNFQRTIIQANEARAEKERGFETGFENAAASVSTDANIISSNNAAYPAAIEEFNAINPGVASIDPTTGKVSVDGSLQQQEQFAAIAKKYGVRQIQTLAQKQEAAVNALPKGTPSKYAAKVREYIRDRGNAAAQIQDQRILDGIVSFDSGVDTILEREIQFLDENFASDKARLNSGTPQSPKEIAESKTALYSRLQKSFDDDRISATMYGGGELLEQVGNILSTGVGAVNSDGEVILPKVWEVEQFIGSSSAFDEGFFSADPAVNVGDLRAKVKAYLESNPTGNAVTELKALNYARKLQVDVLNKKALQDKSTNLNVARLNSGIPNTALNQQVREDIGTPANISQRFAQDVQNNTSISNTFSQALDTGGTSPIITPPAQVQIPQQVQEQVLTSSEAGTKLQSAIDNITQDPNVNQGSVNSLFGDKKFTYNYAGDRKTANGKKAYKSFLAKVKEINQLKKDVEAKAKEEYRALVHSRLNPTEQLN